MNEHRDHCPRLLSLAVHEFRTPVAVVSGYLRMLLRHFADDLSPQQLKLLQESEKSCGALARLLTDLSELGHLEGNASKLRREPVRVFALIREVASNVQEGLDRGVTLEVSVPEPDVLITGDAERLASALASVLAAVLRERAEPGQVVVSGRVDSEPAPVAVIAIGDAGFTPAAHGAGTGPDEPFDEYRGGMGFRLPIAARVIEAHGGHLASPVTERGRLSIVLNLPITLPEAERTG